MRAMLNKTRLTRTEWGGVAKAGLLLESSSSISRLASSNQALQRVRHLFGAAKAGHTGNLDPLASGVLPICLGEATKLSQYLLIGQGLSSQVLLWRSHHHR